MCRLGIAAAALALAACAHGGGQAPAVSLERRIILASDEAGGDVAAYAVFANAGPDTAIVAAQCDCAERFELHFINRDNPASGMVNSWPLELPAGASVAIAPPGVPRHMMAVDLAQPLHAGEVVTIRFRLQDGSWLAGDFTAVESSGDAWQEFERQGL